MAYRFLLVPALWLLPSMAAAADELRPRAGSFTVAALLGVNYGDDVSIRGERLMLAYGARGGYSFEKTPLYLGVTVLGHGSEVEYEDSTETGSEHFVDMQIDVGVELDVRPLILRPYLGVGLMLGVYDGPSEDGSGFTLGLAPGLLVRYPLGAVDVGVDARLESHSIGPTTLSALASMGAAF